MLTFRTLGYSGLVLAVAVALTANTACSSTPTKQGGTPGGEVAKSPVVKVAVASPGSVGGNLAYSGDVKPKDQVNVMAKGLGRIEKLSVDVGDEVRQGQAIGTLDSETLNAQMRQAEASLSLAKARLAQMEAGSRTEQIQQAQANLNSAVERLESVKSGGRESQVAQAQAGLDAAEARLAQLKAGPTKEQLDQAEAGVRAAKNQLYAIQAQADAYLGSRANALGALVFTKEMKEAQSGAAYEQVQAAEAKLAELKAGPTQEQLDQALAAVAQARAVLDLAKNPYSDHDIKQAENAVIIARQQLKLAQSPFTDNDFEVSRSQVAQAQAAVDLVRAQLSDSSITSPITGVVADKFLSVGALASPSVPILSVVSRDLEVALSLEEARAGQVAVGRPVALSVAAYPGVSFDGEVSNVSPTVDPRSRTFAVKVRVKDEQNRLKAGMFAKVVLTAEARENSLVVPEAAVLKRGNDSYAFVVADGKVQMNKVELGPTDGKNVEVLSGLQEGDKVVTGNLLNLKDGDAVSVGEP
ncbi:MAG: efflux RND transporter periplasmic adaptor subunit [Chloroflexi bacterium]|nr:efflux RND transporter periplasmic adaptor subunit [Chloroflexota bacterium]